MRAEWSEVIFLKMWLFRSFQRTHTQTSQITLKKMCEYRGMPAINENWTKWFWRVLGATKSLPSQTRTCCQILSETAHWMKRWCAVYAFPHSATHARSLLWRMLLRAKLSLVGNLLRRRRHAKKDTFEGIFLWQKSSVTFLTSMYLL